MIKYMIRTIDKSHSKTDLIDIINSINLPIIFSHQHNKRNIQEKIEELFESKEELSFEPNHYNINTIKDLQIYVSNPNPKKVLSVKDKATVMSICREICKYCKNKYIIEKTNYKNITDLHDDMRYIIMYGDLPSVRRAAKLMNKNIEKIQEWIPIISPQVKKQLIEKEKSKNIFSFGLKCEKGNYILKFD